VVLYGSKTWSPSLREELKLSVFDNRMLRKIFGLKRNDVIDGRRKLHNLYSSASIIRLIKSGRIMWARHLARMGEERNACKILMGKSEGKRPIGRRRLRCQDNVIMLFNVSVEGFWIDDWIYWILMCRVEYISRFTIAHSLASTVSNRCSVAASNGRHSHSSGFPNCPQPQISASHSNTSRLNLSSSQTD
jgi:hypothetical protein